MSMRQCTSQQRSIQRDMAGFDVSFRHIVNESAQVQSDLPSDKKEVVLRADQNHVGDATSVQLMDQPKDGLLKREDVWNFVRDTRRETRVKRDVNSTLPPFSTHHSGADGSVPHGFQ